MQNITKAYGTEVMIDPKKAPKIERIPCSSLSINYVLGGGVPVGRMITFAGLESGGKSSISTIIGSDFQKAGQYVVYIDAEHSFDFQFAKKLGLDISEDKFQLIQPDYGEMGFDIIEKYVDTSEVGLIILDSASAMMPKAELEDDFGKAQMGSQARMFSQAFRKLAGKLSKTKTTLLVISQIRNKIGVMFGCVHPDTIVEIMLGMLKVTQRKMKMKKLFNLCGVNYKEMQENSAVDVYSRNIKIKSFNHSTNSIEYKQVEWLVRKYDSIMYKVTVGFNYFKCTGDHKIYIEGRGYVEVKNVISGEMVLSSSGLKPVKIKVLKKSYPVLDITVKDNNNYFTNGVLSHNSPETINGGNAIKYYSSIIGDCRRKEEIKDKDDERLGIITQLKTTKNKTAPYGRKALIEIDFKSGVDYVREIVTFAINYGFIQKGGAWFTVEGERFQGQDKVVTYFRENPELQTKYYDMIVKAMANDGYLEEKSNKDDIGEDGLTNDFDIDSDNEVEEIDTSDATIDKE